MLDTTQPIAGLFDLDGVILDTETQYTRFWVSICKQYLNDESIGYKLKGQTLDRIYRTYFADLQSECPHITEQLNAFEASMQMDYIPGFTTFIEDLKKHNVRTAIVTSSNIPKMESVYKQHPELKTVFDFILTAEQFAHSKPAPDPYLLGSEKTQAPITNCFVFEDSFNGLTAGRAAHMHVVGLATTNTAEAIASYADIVVKDFTELSYEKVIRVAQ